MRHRVHGRKLGRTTAHRTALFRNQLTALFTHERIVTTVAKAKELRPLAERMVSLARTGSLPARRRVLTMVPDKLVVRRLFDEVAPRFVDRPGGYTRIVRIGKRHGDGAELALIEFVDYQPPKKGHAGEEAGKPSLMDRARGMFGARKGEGGGETEAPAGEAEMVEAAPADIEEEEAPLQDENGDVEKEPDSE
jgi:large subunit ribosomal protein L17